MTKYASSFTISSSISLSYQRAFHLSLTVLVFYRFPILYLVLEDFYLPYSYCTIKQYYSQKSMSYTAMEDQSLDYHHLWLIQDKYSVIQTPRLYPSLKHMDLTPYSTIQRNDMVDFPDSEMN